MHFQHLFKTISNFAKESFTYLLVVYLLLFLLENILPGFVSNTFDLNYLLYCLIVVGIISSFGSPAEPPVSSPPTISDYFLSIGLSVLGGVLIFLKVDLTFGLKLIISLISGLLILLTSLLVISPDADDLSYFKPHLKHLKKSFNYWPIMAVVFIVISVVVIFQIRQRQAVQPDPKINILLSNCSYNDEIAGNLVKTLIKRGYTHTSSSLANSRDCSGVTVYFAPNDSNQADLIIKSLEPLYPVIQKAPPMEQAPGKVTIVLGNNYF